MKKKEFLVVAMCLFVVSLCAGTPPELKKFPDEANPRKVGEKIVQRYLSEPFRNFDGMKTPPSEVTYPEVCAWFGALKYVSVSRNKEMLLQLEHRFLPLLGKQKELMQKPDHVDHTVFGSVPLQLFMQTQNICYYYIGIDFADRQWKLPVSSKHQERYQEYLNANLSWQTRFWIDDMFMISTIQSQAYLASKDRKYIDRAAYQMTVYLDSIQQPNGLFYHSLKSPFFWCRGNGWMAAGMTEILKYLPDDSPYYNRILAEYTKMISTLESYQNEEGLWGQLVDQPDSWTETSGSAMFTYAIITGVKKGWLNAQKYAPIARKAWIALVSYLDENYDLKEVCMGTNIGESKQYYLDRKRIVGDLHGQAPMLWCATALAEN